jgi:hypothetical protein
VDNIKKVFAVEKGNLYPQICKAGYKLKVLLFQDHKQVVKLLKVNNTRYILNVQAGKPI